MHLTLQPIDNRDIAPIEIDQTLFAIGRVSTPFDSYPTDLVKQLSRRHARLFEDGGSIFLVDLGSQNGTRLNGSRLGESPTPVAPGDEIQFGTLRFKVIDHAHKEPTYRQGTEQQIQLKASGDDRATVVLINEFPCLVGRSEGIIAEYCTIQSIENEMLSRRHALFFANADELFLEDLGSTNGTRVNGAPLSEEPVRLSDGDQIEFGNVSALNFQVSILSPGRAMDATVVAPQATADSVADTGKNASPDRHASPDSPANHASPDRPPTIWMDKPDSFLEVFCDESADSAQETHVDQADPGKTKGVWEYIQGEWRALMLHETPLPGLRRPVPLLRYTVYAVPLVAVLLCAYFIMREDPLAEAVARFDAGDYQGAATIASTEMKPGEANTAMSSLSTEATLNWIIPPWLEAMQQEDTDTALMVLRSADFVTATNVEISTIVQLLSWATNLQQTLAQLSPDASVAISTDQTKIRALIQYWEKNPKLNQHHLGVIVQHRPDFAQMEARILSQLRDLSNTESVYLSAINNLKQALDAALLRDDLDSANALVRDFGAKYPSVTGIKALHHDLDTYGNILATLQKGDLITMAQLWQNHSFHNSVFELAAERRFGPALPSANEMEQLRVAEEAWRGGDFDLANSTLQALVTQQDSDAARARLARQETIMQNYQSLGVASNGDADADAEKLLDFMSGLDQQADQYLYASLQPQVETARAEVHDHVDRLIRNAQASWSQYLEAGGVTARLRLETDVSQEFEQRAGYLVNAHRELSLGAKKLGIIPVDLDQEASLLANQVVSELELQRSSINDLRLLLGNELADRKLQLLNHRTILQE